MSAAPAVADESAIAATTHHTFKGMSHSAPLSVTSGIASVEDVA